MMLVKASMYKNNKKRSLKSRRQHSYEAKQKKCQKCNTLHGMGAYPKTTELNVTTAPKCGVGC